MSFLLMAVFVFDTFLGFVGLRKEIEAKRLTIDAATPPPTSVQIPKVPDIVPPSSVSPATFEC